MTVGNVLDDVQLSAVIADIYDAALDPALWPRALERSCGFIGGATGAVSFQDATSIEGGHHYAWNDDPHYTRLYLSRYVRLNPMLTAFLALPVGEVIAGSAIMPYAELRASRFYTEWCAPQGYSDVVGVMLEKSAFSYSAISFAVADGQGLADARMQRRLALLTPHFRRAVAVAKLIDLRKLETAAFADALDHLAAGVFLVDAEGRLVHANASGRAMAERGDAVRDAWGVLSVADAAAGRTLHAAYAHAARAEDAEPRISAVHFESRTGEPHVAHVLPLTTGARRAAGVGYAAAAAVFVRRAALDLPSPIETVARLYGLTGGELRTMHAIIEVGGVADAAPVLGVSEATVKTHLHHVFAKTGVSRQADLVKLLAAHVTPFVAPAPSFAGAQPNG